MKKRAIADSLEAIRKQNNGMLRPSDVVEAASDPKHPLHDSFEWDDGLAAIQHRLSQARRMIRYVIIVIYPDAEPFRAYVALTTDQETGAGYRPVAECIENEKLRQQMLDDALKEMQRFERHYGLLVELVGLFSEVKRIHKTRANR